MILAVEGMLAQYFSPKIYVGSLVHFIQGHFARLAGLRQVILGSSEYRVMALCCQEVCLIAGLVSSVKITGDFSSFVKDPQKLLLHLWVQDIFPVNFEGVHQGESF